MGQRRKACDVHRCHKEQRFKVTPVRSEHLGGERLCEDHAREKNNRKGSIGNAYTYAPIARH